MKVYAWLADTDLPEPALSGYDNEQTEGVGRHDLPADDKCPTCRAAVAHEFEGGAWCQTDDCTWKIEPHPHYTLLTIQNGKVTDTDWGWHEDELDETMSKQIQVGLGGIAESFLSRTADCPNCGATNETVSYCEGCSRFLCGPCHGEHNDLSDVEECRECGLTYPEGGDGYDGRCPDCADQAEAVRL